MLEGDSGGPLLVMNSGEWHQIGVASYFNPTAPGRSFYVRTAYVWDWIAGHVPLTGQDPPSQPDEPTTPPVGPQPNAVGTIITFAGTGQGGYGGDGGPAVQARLSYPNGVAVDDAGNLYIADRNNHRIRKVDSSGIITTVVGTGGDGYGGDDGLAVQARLNQPIGVATDSAGNLYIADTDNHRIRKVDSSGIITTVAGTGGDGYGGDGGLAVQARLNRPKGVATDSAGNLYIADSNNQRIRKVDSSGIITTVAGPGRRGARVIGDGGPATAARLWDPTRVAVDGAGNLYIADRINQRIRKVDSSGIITTVAGTGETAFGGYGGDGGPAAQARLSNPYGVAADSAGNLYIADSGNRRIRKVDSSGIITTVAGTGGYGDGGDGGPAVQARLSEPYGVATDSAGNLYIADSLNNRIRVVKFRSLQTEPPSPPVGPLPTVDGTITTIAGTGERGYGGDGGPAVDAQLNGPWGVAVDIAANIYIAESGSHRIRKVDPSGTISTVAGTGEGSFGGDNGPAVQGRLSAPTGMAVDDEGNLYIADYNNRRIRKVDSSGVITTIAGSRFSGECFGGDGGPAIQAGLCYPYDVALDTVGNIYIADRRSHRIRKVDTSGIITTIAGSGGIGRSGGEFRGDGGPATQALLNDPAGVTVDIAGNIYIADTENDRIRKVDTSGIITTIAGSGQSVFYFRDAGDGGPATEASLSSPRDVAVDGAGNLYIADSGWLRIRKVDSSGTITTIAGGGQREVVGDGGPATDAWLNRPTGVALDSVGNLYIAELDSHRVRVVKTKPLLTGDQIYYFPHLAVGASWQTTITYINYSPEEVSCQTDFLSDQGDPLMVSFPSLGSVDSRTDVLSPGGSVHEETDVDLSVPIAAGWARVTCSGPVKASLLFRQYDSAGVPVAEAGVNATTVPAKRFVTFAEQAAGRAGTGVAYANPSSTEARITFTAKDVGGQTLATENLTVLPGGHGAQNMASLFGLGSFSGSLEVASTKPIVSLSLNAEAAPVFSSLPPGEPDAAAQGPTTYYFPHLAAGASWQTTLTYINASSREVACVTEFISDHGGPLLVSFPGRGTLMDRTDVLSPGGSVHEETDVELNTLQVSGWAKAACTGPVKASLLFRQYNSEGIPVAEAGVNATAVPATRFVAFAEQAEGLTGTAVAYANPSETAAHVTFTAKDTAGQTLASVVRTVLPDGHDAHVMSTLFGFTSFSGSLEVTSTEPIVSLSLNFEAAPVFSSLPPGEVDESTP